MGQNLKLSRRGSVTGMPCETAVGSGGVKWWVGAKGMEMAGGLCVRKREVGGRGLGQKPETEHLMLGFGLAVRNGGVGK